MAIATDLIKVNASDAFYFIICPPLLIIYDFIYGPWQMSSLPPSSLYPSISFPFQPILQSEAFISLLQAQKATP